MKSRRKNEDSLYTFLETIQNWIQTNDGSFYTASLAIALDLSKNISVGGVLNLYYVHILRYIYYFCDF